MPARPDDQYKCFRTLEKGETLCETYCSYHRVTDSPVAVVAPHGGWIEEGTAELAAAIAGDAFNLYVFEGLPPKRQHHELHLASHLFDEPQCLALVSKCDFVVAVHGRKDKLHDHKKPDPTTILLGGLDEQLRGTLESALNRANFRSRFDKAHFPATHENNICNMGKRRKGVQLELPKSLRLKLLMDDERKRAFVSTMRQAIEAQIQMWSNGRNMLANR